MIPGRSYRNGRTTIYGGGPAICFTEAPLYDFVKYVEERGSATRCSHYGICVLKQEVFQAGGRPAIYGLSGATPSSVSTPHRRILESDVLPLREQFRYVAYDPTRETPLDFSHEREWRWIPTDSERHVIIRHSHAGIEPVPALPLFLDPSAGGSFSQIGFLVRTRAEASSLAEILLGYRDAGCNDFDNSFSVDVLTRAFVIPLDDALGSGAHRIEDLESRHRVVAQRQKASETHLEKVRLAVTQATVIAENAAREFLSRARRTKDGHVADVCGGALVITGDTTTAVTDALLSLGLARPTGGKYYTVDCLRTIRNEQALAYHEAAAEAAAHFLTAELGQPFYTRTWWD